MTVPIFEILVYNQEIFYNIDDRKRIVDNTLIGLTLMIVESYIKEKDTL